jgi:diguanylate cyclase (GGDEF)-like protein/PAS domain S-box-containing protein
MPSGIFDIRQLFRIDRATPVWRVYLLHILLALVVIFPVALTQAYRFFEELPPHFFFGPMFLSVIIGSLLSRSALLKRDLQSKTEQFRAIADLAQEFTYLRRVDGLYEYVSPSCIELTGYDQQAFYDTPNLMDQLIHPEDKERWERHIHHVNDKGCPEAFDLRLLAKDGTPVWFNHICMPVLNDKGEQVGVRSTNLNISERKQGEARIEHMAYFDVLTDLPNRRSLQRHIKGLIDVVATGGHDFPVLFLDLDRFKNINDSFGHQFGDRLLRIIARRIEEVSGEGALVCRFGGDEFVVVLDHTIPNATVKSFAAELLRAIELPLELDGVELHISASVGIAFYPGDGEDADTLIRNADVAMYKTKRQGSGNIHIYSANDSEAATHFITTETKIHKGLQQQEFIVYYQPKVDMVSGQIVGMEALARWQHPTQGLLSPADFIAVAEETGQINALGQQVLHQVLLDLAHWQREGIALPVAVNVSARQFAETEFGTTLVAMLAKEGVLPAWLELEVTEQVFLGDVATARERLMKLREAGLTIALDDFGTGFSSFGYLRQLPVDTLKIDRSFICNIDTDRAEIAIIRAIVSMCRELQLKVVVEGVETTDQADALLSLGCDVAQGYFYHYPMPVAELNHLLHRQVLSKI